MLRIAAERDARNAAPDDFEMDADAVDIRLIAWNERWAGLRVGSCLTGGIAPRQSCCARVPSRRSLACCRPYRNCTNVARAAAIVQQIFGVWRCGLPRRAAMQRSSVMAGRIRPIAGAASGVGGGRREGRREYALA